MSVHNGLQLLEYALGLQVMDIVVVHLIIFNIFFYCPKQMGNTLATEKSNDDLRTRLDTVTAHYTNLYREYQETTDRNIDLTREVERLRGLESAMQRVLDDKNVSDYLVENENSMLEDAFEKIYISKYHAYLKALVSLNSDKK